MTTKKSVLASLDWLDGWVKILARNTDLERTVDAQRSLAAIRSYVESPHVRRPEGKENTGE